MAVAPQIAPLEIVDLARFEAHLLGPLFEEEQQEWLEQLHWDYRPSVEMLRKHINARSLPGYVALVGDQVAGYTFFVQEERKGMIGDLYVRESYRAYCPAGAPQGVASTLLERALDALDETPGLARIETQLMAFGTEGLDSLFLRRGFQCFPRLFMYKALGEPDPELAELRASSPTRGNLPPACQFRLWDDAYFEPTAELIVDAYASHFDSQLNDQYAGLPGALRFLQNIVVFPGCGVFLSDASLLAIETGTGQLLGVVLLSRVGPRIGHVTQICLRPAWQGLGIGRTLLQAALDRLRGKDFRAVSLTVTAANHNAVHLYQQLGFNVIKRFSAYARTCPLPRA